MAAEIPASENMGNRRRCVYGRHTLGEFGQKHVGFEDLTHVDQASTKEDAEGWASVYSLPC